MYVEFAVFFLRGTPQTDMIRTDTAPLCWVLLPPNNKQKTCVQP